MTEYKLDIDGTAITLSRVNVILGANGAGKSTLIKKLKKGMLGELHPRPKVYVEGGRALALQPTMEGGGPGPMTAESAASAHSNAQTEGTLANRTRELLARLAKEHAAAAQEFHALTTRWNAEEASTRGARPEAGATSLTTTLEVVNTLFPQISMRHDSNKGALVCGASGYSASELSDGEKQALCLVADVGIFAPRDAVVLVDEPELNLHSLLAQRVWNEIEGARPDLTFVYATHSVPFAMRASVDHLFLLRGRPAKLTALDGVRGIHREEAREFLGAAPAIAIAKRTLLVEGTEDSFDVRFFRWLVGDELNVVPLESCTAVIAAARGATPWKSLLVGEAVVHGVVDRDYRTDAEIAKLTTSGVYVLPLHEAESYICSLDVWLALEAKKSKEKIIDEAKTIFSVEKVGVIGARVSCRLAFSGNASISASDLKGLTKDALLKVFADASRKRSDEAGAVFSSGAVERVVNEEWDRCADALAEPDADKLFERLLVLAPGKMLAAKLGAPRLEALVHKVKPSDCASTKTLRDALLVKFQT